MCVQETILVKKICVHHDVYTVIYKHSVSVRIKEKFQQVHWITYNTTCIGCCAIHKTDGKEKNHNDLGFQPLDANPMDRGQFD